jgi:hypothetical protein
MNDSKTHRVGYALVCGHHIRVTEFSMEHEDAERTGTAYCKKERVYEAIDERRFANRAAQNAARIVESVSTMTDTTTETTAQRERRTTRASGGRFANYRDCHGGCGKRIPLTHGFYSVSDPRLGRFDLCAKCAETLESASYETRGRFDENEITIAEVRRLNKQAPATCQTSSRARPTYDRAP